jgi:antitoxin Phd
MKHSASRQSAEKAAKPAGATIPATEAQNNFGRVLGRAKREGRVFITRYEQPEAVLLSIEEYDALTGRESVDLRALEREFDAMLHRMQGPEHGRAVDRLFAMTGSQLGKAALAQADAATVPQTLGRNVGRSGRARARGPR